ncbi:hypothetical protein F4823DRAFT_147403 [Ustulina deusta]|nr:hypothetical protein F4823DRAFT_147403 [Ustulina deusta]
MSCFDTNYTMNNAYYNINRETGEVTESPVIPLLLTQNFPRPQQTSHSAAGSKGPELEKWKSRVPKTGNSLLVPKPLFSSEKCVVEVEPITAMSEAPIRVIPLSTIPATVSASPTSTTIPTTTIPTPISPSPSLFPMPPSSNGIVVSPVTSTSPVSLHASDSVVSRSSVYSQSTIGNTMAAAVPRLAGSIYWQNNLTTAPATAVSSPRTPTLTNWASILPGLSNAGAPLADVHAHQQSHVPTPMEQVLEEQQAPQQIPAQIQVPRLRSPSLPQDRGNRRRTTSSVVGGGVNMHGNDGANISTRSLVQSPEQVSYPEMSTVAVDYGGGDWPLQKPSGIHNIPQSHYLCRPRESDVSRSESHSHHVANKESTSSSFTHATPSHHESEVALPRASMAGSHTPIYGPREQRSGWWSDEEQVAEQGRRRTFSYAVIGMKEKPTTEARRRRAKKIKIIVGASILAILIIVGVAVGVTLGVRSS